MIESFFHFPAKYCTGSNMFIKTKQLHASSRFSSFPFSRVSGLLRACPDILAQVHLELQVHLWFQITKQYFRNVCYNLCFIFLMYTVLDSLFICIHLLVTCFFSVDKLVCLLVFNWLKKSRAGSPPPQCCPSAYHIPWPRVLIFSSPVADVATLHVQELT